jgi:hypothetical protein
MSYVALRNNLHFVIPERFSRESIFESGSPTKTFGDDSFLLLKINFTMYYH